MKFVLEFFKAILSALLSPENARKELGIKSKRES